MRIARTILQVVFLVAALSFLWPALVSIPIVPQNPVLLESALAVTRQLMVIEAACVGVAVGVLPGALLLVDRREKKHRLVYLTLAVVLCALASRADIYQLIFHPLGRPSFAPVAETLLDPREKVMVVSLNGTVRAYPVRGVAYHHVVNDVVAGVPLAVTYCGLCHTGIVWARDVDGMTLTFHIAGINNQNFLMRDDETGTWWQQVSGRAISGPLKGKALRLIRSEELSFGVFRDEQPGGMVLRAKPGDEKFYSPLGWEKTFEKIPVVVTHPGEGFDSKDLMLSVVAGGEVKAFPYNQVLAEKLIRDRVGSEPVLLVAGPDNTSVRAFKAPASEFYRTAEKGALMMDAATGSKWNFQGCAVDGVSKGQCLEGVQVTKDYWFDWRSYHPQGAVYRKSKTAL